jgi:cysteine desulfuration protein SufE
VQDKKVYFKADSVALISKGMVSLLADIFSDTTREQIKSFDSESLEKLELRTLLTPGRRNGTYNMLLRIKRMGDPN